MLLTKSLLTNVYGGCRIAVEGFEERHGLRACMVAPTKIIAGLGMSLGMDCLSVPGATGAVLSNYFFHSGLSLWV